MKPIRADGKKSSIIRALLLCILLTALAGGLFFAIDLTVYGIIAFSASGVLLVVLILFALFAPPEEK